MKIAVLGNVTLDFFAQDFRRAGHEVWLAPGFDAWRSAVLDDASGLHAFDPEAILLVLESGSTKGAEDQGESRFVAAEVTAEAAELLRSRFPHARVVIPPLAALADETPGFYDERMRKLAAMPFSLKGIKAIEEEFGWEIGSDLFSQPKKILALDADNTLWRGIISEDGAESVTPYAEFQRGVLALRERGVLLLLLSKNDPPTAEAPVTRAFARTDMPLKLSDFAEVRVNWGPKAGNLLAACRQLNLGVDSVVFVDDNSFERAQMQANLPQVAVPPFPADLTRPAQFLRRLDAAYFAEMGKTAEDRARAAMYQAESARRDAAVTAATLEGYLDSLHMVCTPLRAVADDVPRLAQMAGKTNQFNAMTIRRTAADFERLLADSAMRVWVFRVRDDFGDMGIICYVVAELATGRIRDFVMSCRAMGRTIEHFALNHVRRELAAEGVELAGIDCMPTAKNGPIRDFLATVDWRRELSTRVTCGACSRNQTN